MSFEAWKEVAARIVGDIVLSTTPGKIMRKWREHFRVTQTELSEVMGVSSSVISDYESGRRRSPGTKFLKKFVISLIEIDERRGGHTLRSLSSLMLGSLKLQEAVLDMREFDEPMESKEFCDKINAELIVGTGRELLLGYTVVDSMKLVVDVPAIEYIRLYGATTQRAAIFTGVTLGRSPIIAVKAMQAGMGGLRPALVVMQGVSKPDKLAVLIAQKEGIPLAICGIGDASELIHMLRSL
ncbi:MAG: helix-turn-helix domain-containing protein [Thermofilaceae archaeon]|nr:helix-turn-helix domain-containing protein [Thermofilaceae archaeon]MCX8181304.1 helix-turn-helix domain-containing protein [Thermofilaceae archaeon]MDW8004647.1 helix-turn-helix domain-containing protein [Thermofilaceae archaeon]